MSQSSKFNHSNPYENFMEALLEELIATPDEQILEGKDPKQVLSWGQEVLHAAQAEAGRRRVEAAKRGLEKAKQLHESTQQLVEDVSAADARAYLARVSNDSRYTMAARTLGELSTEEVLRLYKQMRSLELVSGEKGWSS
jgi:hypothetical protein